MSKERFITRTIKSVKVTVVGVNVANNPATLETKTFLLTGNFENDGEILSHIREKNPTFVPAQVTEKEESEELYRIKESIFMQYAEKVTK